jgi:hypothetical protein
MGLAVKHRQSQLNFRNDVVHLHHVRVKFRYIIIGKSHITTRTPFRITSNGLEYIAFTILKTCMLQIKCGTHVQSYPFIYEK